MKTLLTAALALALASATTFAQRTFPGNPDRPVRSPSRAVGPELGRGVNFGNMLEAPFEGAWGLTVEERFFDVAVQAGMEHIRLPVSWTHHTACVYSRCAEPAKSAWASSWPYWVRVSRACRNS